MIFCPWAASMRASTFQQLHAQSACPAGRTAGRLGALRHVANGRTDDVVHDIPRRRSWRWVPPASCCRAARARLLQQIISARQQRDGQAPRSTAPLVQRECICLVGGDRARERTGSDSALAPSGTRVSGGTVYFTEGRTRCRTTSSRCTARSTAAPTNINQLKFILYRPLYWYGNNYSPTVDYSYSIGQQPVVLQRRQDLHDPPEQLEVVRWRGRDLARPRVLDERAQGQPRHRVVRLCARATSRTT